MKTLKTICAAAILSLALASQTVAGDIQTPTFTNPPPPPAASVEMPGLVDIILALYSLL